MQDLIKKIQDLRELMKGLLAKPGQNSLVPALKSPTVRPIAMPSGSSKPTEIPGVTPPSGKDPMKVAQQLKNPRPKKPKMEMLKFNERGQWSLEKNWKHKDLRNAGKWMESGDRDYLEKLPRAKGDLRTKMMTTLSSHGESRVNPTTKEREHKLYRTAAHDDDNHHSRLSSWTANPDFAYYWADINKPLPDEKDSDMKPNKVMHAWVPEKHIHSYLGHFTESGAGVAPMPEKEVMVEPHKFNIFHQETGPALERQIAIAHKKITSKPT